MYVVAVFLKRYSLMSMGIVYNPLGQYAPPYVPSLTEVLIALMILAIGVLIVTVAAKVLPLVVPEDAHGSAHESALPEGPAEPALEAR